jgi:hypothetical protein
MCVNTAAMFALPARAGGLPHRPANGSLAPNHWSQDSPIPAMAAAYNGDIGFVVETDREEDELVVDRLMG